MKRGLTTNTDTIRRIYRIQDDKAVYYEDSNQNVFTDAFSRHPLFCKDFLVEQRCGLEGYLNCPHDGLKEQLQSNCYKVNSNTRTYSL